MSVQSAALSVGEYLKLPETTDHEELEFGWIVREPTPNAMWHQGESAWLMHLLYDHVDGRGIGQVLAAPTGVVLDKERALVVQPDLMVLLADRVHYIGDQVWGPPNLVIEIASPSTRRRDRDKKVEWYRTYGVQECWLVDSRIREIRLFHLEDASDREGRLFRGDEVVDSRVLPDLRRTAIELFRPSLRDPQARTSYDKDRP